MRKTSKEADEGDVKEAGGVAGLVDLDWCRGADQLHLVWRRGEEGRVGISFMGWPERHDVRGVGKSGVAVCRVEDEGGGGAWRLTAALKHQDNRATRTANQSIVNVRPRSVFIAVIWKAG